MALENIVCLILVQCIGTKEAGGGSVSSEQLNPSTPLEYGQPFVSECVICVLLGLWYVMCKYVKKKKKITTEKT